MKKFIAILIIIFIPSFAFAAEVYFEAQDEVYVTQPFVGQVYLSLAEEANAVEGVLFYSETLEVESINDGNSKINFWITKPKSESPGRIVFSGITPSGLRGSKNLLFNVTFSSKIPGQGSIYLKDIKVLSNDGEGTPIETTSKDFNFTVREGSSIEKDLPKDTELPESFKPELSRNPLILDGKWFVAFSTQDKNSGIKSYEIKEERQWIRSFFSEYVPAESPYVLEDQDLRSFVWIKVTDNSGNERIETIAPRYPLPWWENTSYWIIIILILVILGGSKWIKRSTQS